MAKALWSESSRKMAHNLDDLYERWKLRREALAETERQDLDRYSDMFVQAIDVSNLSAPEDCETLKGYALETYRYLEAQIVNHKRALSEHPPRPQASALDAEIAALKHINYKIGLEVRKLNSRRADLNRKIHTKEDAQNRNRHYIRFLRGSMVGIKQKLESGEMIDVADALDQILDYSFSKGDHALFNDRERDIDNA